MIRPQDPHVSAYAIDQPPLVQPKHAEDWDLNFDHWQTASAEQGIGFVPSLEWWNNRMDLHPDKKPVESCDDSNPDDK